MVDAAAIAADVARRYGVPVCPSVVQLCPPCTFASTTPVWDARTRTLVYRDKVDRKALLKKAFWTAAAEARAAARDPAILQRRAAVAVLHAQGLCVRQIADSLCVTYAVALSDHHISGLVPNAYVTSAMTQSTLRAARIRDLHGEGWTVRRIAALMGIGHDTVRDLALKHYGLRFAHRVAAVAQVKPPKAPGVTLAQLQVAAGLRKARVAAMIGQGVTLLGIAALLGVSAKQVRRDCRDVGIGPLRAGRWRDKAVAA